MKANHWIRTALVTVTLVSASAVVTAKEEAPLFKKPQQAVDYRQATFTAIRHNFGQMRAMLGGKRTYDQKEFQQRADNLAALAQMPWEAFLPDTDMKTMGGNNSALPEVWTKNDKFLKLARLFEQNTAALAMAAKTGDKGKIKKALGKMGKEGCKACHNKFKD